MRLVQQLDQQQRGATADERQVLSRWSGWGAVPQIFDEDRVEWERERGELRELLGSDDSWNAARRNTLNAHYTDRALVTQMWETVRGLGFTGGTVLEPGVGAGGFLAEGPGDCRYIGVELDPTTAAITRHLYPEAEIHAESFARTSLPDGSVDVVIGNVPFGNYKLHDPQHNTGRYSIHNHFLLKSLALTRPGGVLVAITSRFTLDSRDNAHRAEMAGLADLVGAVRLPETAHRAAGTETVTDIVVFRRREPGEPPRTPQTWLQTRDLAVGDESFRVNAYFADNPQQVAGTFAATSSMYGANQLTVTPSERPLVAVAGALSRVTDQAHTTGAVLTPPTPGAAASRERAQGPELGEPSPFTEGAITRSRGEDRGEFVVTVNGRFEPHTIPASQRRELGQLLELRDATQQLLRAEADRTVAETMVESRRQALNEVYDTYVAKYGPLNRFSWRRTGRVDKQTGEEKLARIRPPQGKFRLDPHSPLVFALEHFHDATQTATKADIFTQRVLSPATPRDHADTPADALAITLDTHGRIDLDEIGRLLDTTPQQARERLGELVFADPAQDAALVTAADYLSGNVREKLDLAKAMAEVDQGYSGNVTALRAALPRDLTPEDITPQMGAVWIPASDVQQFLQQLLQDPSLRVVNAGTSWEVVGEKYSALATGQWGTDRKPAPDIAQAALEQRTIVVRDTVHISADKTRNVLNTGATLAAQEKAEAMREAFAEWVWTDPKRTERLLTEYNRRFNSIVLRSYDSAQLALPGIKAGWEPNSHQVAAVARMINEPAVGLYHEVGAGKTAAMVMGVMEQRRLGLVSKPVVVVPNNMLEQMAREWQQLYPQAKVLMTTKEDLTRERRRAFVGRIATGDWDGIVMTRSAFERIPMSPEAQQQYLEKETERLRAQIERLGGSRSRLVKRIESAMARAEERIERQVAAEKKDPGVRFEETGIDYVVVDEAHGYKNLRTASEIPGAAIEGSNRASDLDMKLSWLRERNEGGRVGTFATATPIANSITEAHVMQRFLRPDLLEQAGIAEFDAWAATFGQTVTGIELSPDGSSFRMQSRFAKFRNVPELLRTWHVSADIKTAEDLRLPVPNLAMREDGKRGPETVQVAPSPELESYIAHIVKRAEDLRNGNVDPRDDNMLAITGDGRAAALDLRLILAREDPQLIASSAGGATTKLDVAADRIAAIHHQHAGDTFLRPDGSTDPVPGSLQIVFSDLGTPHPEEPQRWTAYEQLREDLVDRGVPREKIAFIHSATDDKAKGRLFEACRTGQISVLMGSTEKMGVGTNVQTRAVALHHLDCPWRPADVQQREGRILRRGNQHDEVRILRYITERSFDAYSWQGVSRKAEFIAQVMRGTLDVREIEDIGDNALSYNEVKALATGRPEVIEHAEAKAELTRLERSQRAHDDSQRRLAEKVDQSRRRLPVLEQHIQITHRTIDQVLDTRGDKFALSHQGRRFTERGDAGAVLVDAIRAAADQSRTAPNREVTKRDVFQLGGLPHHITAHQHGQLGAQVELSIGDTPAATMLTGKDLPTLNATGVISRLEKRLQQLPNFLRKLENEHADEQHSIDQGQGLLGQTWPHTQALKDARANVERLEALLAEETQEAEQHAAQDAAAEENSTPVADAPPERSQVGEPTAHVQTQPPPQPASSGHHIRSALARRTISAPVLPPRRRSRPQRTDHEYGR